MERVFLRSGTNLSVTENITGYQYQFLIRRQIGCGASCLVYEACYADCPSHFVRIKECYPVQNAPIREGRQLKWPEESKKEKAFENFEEGFRIQRHLQGTEEIGNAAVHMPIGMCEGNNTRYIVMEVDYGETLDRYPISSLEDALVIAKALAGILGGYHRAGYLHLDLKPENVLVLRESPSVLKLFDLDSLVYKQDIKNGSFSGLSYSPRWAAPELREELFSQISERTDIYAVGAVLFWMVMGREVGCDDRSIFAEWKFDGTLFEGQNPQLQRVFRQIFRRTLCCRAGHRFGNTHELTEKLDKALTLIREKKPYLVSNVERVARFIGRKKELEAIRADFEREKAVVILSGVGGIGKSTLARQYAWTNFGPQSRYDTISFCRYQESAGIRRLLSDLPLQNVNSENNSEVFRAVRSAMNEHTLLILDNFDVDSPGEDWEVLMNLPCDVLVTTRTDFSDWTGDQQIVQHSVDTLEESELIQLFEQNAKIRLDDAERDVLKEILIAVGNHTFIVELLAKQLTASDISLEQLKENLFGQEEIVRYQKDGQTKAETIRQGLDALFSMAKFTAEEKEVMCSVWTLYGTGLCRYDYRIWTCSTNLNALNRLIHLGWIKESGEEELLDMHPLVAETVFRQLDPSAGKCKGIHRYITGALPHYDETEEAWNIEPRAALWTYSRWMLQREETVLEEVNRLLLVQGFIFLVDQYRKDNESEFWDSLYSGRQDPSPAEFFEPLISWARKKISTLNKIPLGLVAQYCLALLRYEDQFSWENQDKEFFRLRRGIDAAAALFTEMYQECIWGTIKGHVTMEYICDEMDDAFYLGWGYAVPNTPALHKLYCIKYEQLKKCLLHILSAGTEEERKKFCPEIQSGMSSLMDAFQQVGDSALVISGLRLPGPKFSLQESLKYQPPAFPPDFVWDR